MTAGIRYYDHARAVLGEDFISPEEMVQTRRLGRLVYSEEVLAKFHSATLFPETFLWCRDNGMGLVAGPPIPMSVFGMRARGIGYFSYQDFVNAWDCEKFAHSDKVEPVWIAIHKEPIADSFREIWASQRGMVSDPLAIPNVAEVAWGLIAYKAVRNICLLPHEHVRTSSVDSDGCHVGIGGFREHGFSIGASWDCVKDPDLGISAARRFPPA